MCTQSSNGSTIRIQNFSYISLSKMQLICFIKRLKKRKSTSTFPAILSLSVISLSPFSLQWIFQAFDMFNLFMFISSIFFSLFPCPQKVRSTLVRILSICIARKLEFCLTHNSITYLFVGQISVLIYIELCILSVFINEILLVQKGYFLSFVENRFFFK